MAKKLGIHPQTIAISLKNLQEAGYISISRVGLNRNDKIRCLKTIKREKKEEIRMECTHSIKKEPGHSPPLLHNKRTNKRDITEGTTMLKERDYKITAGGRIKNDYKNPYGPYIPHPTDEKITPIPSYQAETDDLLSKIKENVRKQSYSFWFDGKIALSYVDNKRIEVSCTDITRREWVEENYKSLIERLSGKKASFVVIYRKKVTDGEVVG